MSHGKLSLIVFASFVIMLAAVIASGCIELNGNSTIRGYKKVQQR